SALCQRHAGIPLRISRLHARTTLSGDIKVLRRLARTPVAHIMILSDCRENLRFAAGEAPEGVRRIGRSRAAAQMCCPGLVSRGRLKMGTLLYVIDFRPTIYGCERRYPRRRYERAAGLLLSAPPARRGSPSFG